METYKKEQMRIETILNNIVEISIMQHDLKTYTTDKLVKLMSIYKTPSDYFEDYLIVEDFLLNNNVNKKLLETLSDTARFVANIFKQKELHPARIKYFTNYFKENPMKAFKIVLDFLDDNDMDVVSSHLYSHNLCQEEFDCAVKMVKRSDEYLAEEYIKKLGYLENSKYDRNVAKMQELALGIETGYLSDGTKFDELQFWKLAPFKYSKGIVTDFKTFREKNPNVGYIGIDNFYRRIEAFGRGVIPNKIDIVLDYMKKNNFLSYTYIDFNKYKMLNRGRNVKLRGSFSPISCGEETFTKLYGAKDMRKLYDKYYIDYETRRNILNEVIEKGLPHLMEVYSILEERYIKEYNELNKCEEDSLKKGIC